MPMKIVVLEDNEERRNAMRTALADRFPFYESHFFTDPRRTIAYLENNLEDTILISLDHDLELIPDETNGNCRDPGCGREVADYLSQKQPACPVIIHTTNAFAAAGMECVLHEAGWATYRVSPSDDTDWISSQWIRTVRNAIVALAKPAARRHPRVPSVGH
jgi:CheY-like chemotaxis protein